MKRDILRSTFISISFAGVLGVLVFLACDGGTVNSYKAAPVKIAFVGDQGFNEDTIDVLELIKSEDADALLILGDFDYEGNPSAWYEQMTGILGTNFPIFGLIGNHDVDDYYGEGGYQSYLEDKMNSLGISWEGDLGVKSSFYYQDIFFVLTAPGTFEVGDPDHEYGDYIEAQFENDDSVWRVSAWHHNQREMQLGGKGSKAGWEVYEESREAGAIIATAHEHSYSRTHALSRIETQTVASDSNTIELVKDDPTTPGDEGISFVFVSGLGGRSIRDQTRCLPSTPPYGCNGEWASIYTNQQNAASGVLFGVFNHNDNPCLARFYFKAINGDQPDEFLVRSTLSTCANQ